MPASLASVVPAGVRVLTVRGGPQKQRRIVLARLPHPLPEPAAASPTPCARPQPTLVRRYSRKRSVALFKVPGMTYEFQVTVDCAAPHTLADWWADLLGWQVEPSDEAFIRRMIAEGHASDEQTATHKGSLVWKEGAAIVHPDGSGRR